LTDLISTPHNTLHNEWVFIACVFLLAVIAFLRVYFGRGLWLISQAAFTQRHANQFLRENNNLNLSPYLFSLFVLVLTFFIAHPSWNQTSWSILTLLEYTFWISLFFSSKYLLIRWIGHILQQLYLFEEVIFHSFLFEKVAGLLMFPFLVLSIYSPFDSVICLQIGLLFLFFFLLLKWVRMLWLGFFKRSFSKTHLFIYLCILEILPLVVIVKYFLL
tara:strand:- start:1825 stop:2475 length:651 start_codon:yes stop_codon:yes gene_type:complete